MSPPALLLLATRLLGEAAAAPPELAAWTADAATLTLGDELLAVEGLTAQAGAGTLRLSGGVGRAIWSGAASGGAPPRVVGVVAVGPGAFHLAVPHAPTAQGLANRIVGWLGGDRARGDALVAGRGLSTSVEAAVVVGAGVAEQLGAPVPVTDPDAIAASLADLWAERTALVPAEVAPGRFVGLDRLRVEQLGADPGGSRRWIDARTDQPWGALEPARARTDPAPGDGWLAVVADPDRSLDGVTHAFAYTAGVDTLGRAARQPLVSEAQPGAAGPPVALQAADVRVRAVRDGGALTAEITADLRLTARQATPLTVLRVPASADTVTVSARAGSPSPRLDIVPLGETGRSTWLAVVPRGGLDPAHPLELTVTWADRWPLVGAPASTGLQRFVPGLVPDRLGSPAPFTLQVEAPDGLTLVSSGAPAADGSPAAASLEPVAWPRVALTGWPVAERDGGATLRVAADPSLAAPIQDEVTAILRGLSAQLGSATPTPFAVLQLPPGLRAGEASGGLVALQRPLLADLGQRRADDRARPVLAHELAHLWWGHQARPEGVADRWMAEVLAEVSADLALGARAGPAALAARQARHLQVARRLDPLALPQAWGGADATGHLYHLGPAVLLGPLRRKVGAQTFERALAQLSQTGDITAEALLAQLEAASGQDLGAFWATWIHGGQVPTASARWWLQPAGRDAVTVTAEVTVDLPYGVVEVPVGVLDRRGRVLAEGLVQVEGGRGRLTLGPVRASRVELVLDPHGQALVRPGDWHRGRGTAP